MKFAIVLLNTLLIAIGSIESKPLLRTSDPIIGVVCHESEDGMAVFVPHPSDCSLYYECVGLTPVLMSCPGDLYFDPQLDVCNWPDLVDCQPPTTTEEVVTTTEALEDTTTEAEVMTTEAAEDTTTEEHISTDNEATEGESTSTTEITK